MQRDNQIFEIIDREHLRQRRGVELIASENFVSDEVMRAMGSCLTNKYVEGYPGARYYGGCQVVDEAERLAIERAKKLFDAEWANVQPHSGAQANMAVFMACLQPGDTFMGMDLSHGGHLSHGSPVNFSGLHFRPISYSVDAETGRVNYEEMEQKARAERPKLIIAGASAYSREWDYARVRKLADEIGAIFLVDMAHPAGLIAAGLLENPLKHAHIVTTTTHKTLRGPRGGLILCKEEYAKIIDKAIFPGYQGGPLMHVIAAKAVCFNEALKPEFKIYQEQVIKNSKKLAEELVKLGFNLVSNGTDNHLMLIDLRNKGITGKKLEKRDLIPVISYVLSLGKCRHCKSKISIFYPVVEVLTGLLFALCYHMFNYSYEFYIGVILSSLFIIILVSDITYYIIPDEVLIIGSILIIVLKVIFTGFIETGLSILSGGLMFIVMYLIMLLGNFMFKKENA